MRVVEGAMAVSFLCLLAGELQAQENIERRSSSKKTATVTVWVVDRYIGRVLADPSVTLKPAVTQSSGPRLEGVPYGKYNLHVRAEGYYETVVPLLVDAPEIWVPIGLALGTVSDPADVVVTGMVRTSGCELTWVKLVALLSDYSQQTKATPSGRFSFRIPYLQLGRFLLLEFCGSSLLGTKEVRINASTTTVDFKLSP